MQYINKTTLNFAQNRSIDLTEDDHYKTLSIWVTNEWEPTVVYYVNTDDNTFSYKTNFDLPQDVKEELPATIFSEKQLRQVVKFLADNIACAGL